LEQFDGFFPGGSGDAENPDEMANSGAFASSASAGASGDHSATKLQKANIKPVLKERAEEDRSNSK